MDDKLPIIEMTGDNFHLVWPSLSRAISDASFIAVDCELSGLGNRRKINAPQLDVRYHNLVEVAQGYGVVALGISCFSCLTVTNVNSHRGEKDERLCTHDYIVQTYNVLTMCSDPFTVECDALKFLHKHGFDFNKLYAKGVLYYKGCDRKNDKADKSPSVRRIFNKIIEHGKPLVVHNGLIDLVFLYQSFYCDLPKTNDTFAADLEDLFPQGVYDTKYLAEFHQAVPATYLEYLFKKIQLRNLCNQKNGRWHTRVRFPPYPKHTPSIDWHPYLQIHSYRLDEDQDKRELCQMFAFHGNCKREGCELSHNVNRAVKVLQTPGAKRRGDSKYSGPRSGSLVDTIAKLNRNKEEKEEEEKEGRNRRKRLPKRKIVNKTKEEEEEEEEECKRRKEESEEEGKNYVRFRDAKNDAKDENVSEIKNGLSSSDTKDENVSCRDKNVKENDLSSSDTKNDTKTENTRENDKSRNKNVLSSSDTKNDTKSDTKNDTKSDTKNDMKTGNDKSRNKNVLSSSDTKSDTKNDTKNDMKTENDKSRNKNILSSSDTKNDTKSDTKNDTKSDTKDEDERTRSTSGHRAGYDAFMTGFIFAGIVSDKGVWTRKESPFTAHNIGLGEEVNKVYLMGKNIPFLIRKSAYATKSLKHCSKIEKVRGS